MLRTTRFYTLVEDNGVDSSLSCAKYGYPPRPLISRISTDGHQGGTTHSPDQIEYYFQLTIIDSERRRDYRSDGLRISLSAPETCVRMSSRPFSLALLISFLRLAFS